MNCTVVKVNSGQIGDWLCKEMSFKHMEVNWDTNSKVEVIGVIPAAGRATRIAPLPCSKELYPVGFGTEDHGQGLRPKVVCHYLLEKMRLAGIRKAFIILRQGKWDIPTYLGDGTILDMHIAYLMLGIPFGIPYTIDQAYPFVQSAIVALGFPDTLFEPNEAFVRLLEEQKAGHHDIVLGIFPADRPEKVDMVEIDEKGQVREIVIKPRKTHLRHMWAIAVWTPLFTHFVHEYLTGQRRRATTEKELYMGDVIQAAIDNHIQVKAVHVSHKPLLDIGTGDDLFKAVRYLLTPAE